MSGSKGGPVGLKYRFYEYILMSIFGGEEKDETAEAVENLSRRVEDLESHLNAVDNAVQSTRQESREMDLEAAEENRERLIELEEMMKQITEVQKRTLKDIDSERGKESRHESKINSLQSKLNRTRDSQKEIESRLDRIEDKLFSVEKELTESIELNKGRIESRVSEDQHGKDLKGLKKDISQLKASVGAIADDIDDESIRVE